MATTAAKTQTAVQDATAQAQHFAELVADTSKKAVVQYLDIAEKATESFVGLQKDVAAQTEVEWLAAIINAQAKLTTDVSKVVVSTSRELIK